MIKKFYPVGIVDEELDPKANSESKFSMGGRSRHLQVQSAKQRIDNIRRHNGKLI